MEPSKTLRSHATVAALLAFGFVAAVSLASGVSADHFTRYTLFQAYFTIAPGWVVYSLLFPDRDGFERFGFGWTLGYALAIVAFVASRMLGVPGALAWYPLLILVPGIPAIYRSKLPNFVASGLTPGHIWGTTALGALFLLYFVSGEFSTAPLLGIQADSVQYHPDIAFTQSMASESMHRWPVTMPFVAGAELSYHWFSFFFIGSAASVTGIPLDIVVLRLFYLFAVPMLFMATVNAGRLLFDSARVGILSAAVVLIVGELDFDDRYSQPFFDLASRALYISPSFLLGAVFFLPLVVIGSRIIHEREPRLWIGFFLFGFAAAGSKAAVIPVLWAGVAGLVVWPIVRRRAIDRRAALLVGGLTAILLSSYLLVYRHSNVGLGFGFARSIFDSEAWLVVSSRGGPAWLGVAFAVVVLGRFAKLLGMAIAPTESRNRAYLTWITAAGISAAMVFHQFGFSELAFLLYSMMAGGLLSAAGLDALLTKISAAGAATQFRRAWALWMAVAAWMIFEIDEGLVAWGIQFYSRMRFLLPMLMALTACALFVLLMRRLLGPERRAVPVVGLVAVALISLGAFNVLDHPALMREVATGRFDIDGRFPGQRGITVDMRRGLEWIRTNTDTDAVLAVNNHYRDEDETFSLYFYYSGFSERRVFLESWLYSPEAHATDYEAVIDGELIPYPERYELNRSVFEDADPSALTELVAEHQVSHLVVDKSVDDPRVDLNRIADLVFTNDAIDVFSVRRA